MKKRKSIKTRKDIKKGKFELDICKNCFIEYNKYSSKNL